MNMEFLILMWIDIKVLKIRYQINIGRAKFISDFRNRGYLLKIGVSYCTMNTHTHTECPKIIIIYAYINKFKHTKKSK